MGFSLQRVLITVAKQLYAAVPLSYHRFCNERLGNIFQTDFIMILKTAKIQDFIAVLVFIIISFWCLKGKWKIKNEKCLLSIALVLLLGPALLVGISIKYQKELIWGIGYLPVYLEYFGLVLILFLIIGWLLDELKKEKLRYIVAALCSFVFGFILLIQLQDNRAVIEVLNDGYLYSRELLDESVERGVFSKLDDGSILIVENEPIYGPYPGKDFFSYKTGKHLEVYRMEEFSEQAYPMDTPVYILSYIANRKQQELVLKETSYKGDYFSVKSISKLCLLKQEAKEQR